MNSSGIEFLTLASDHLLAKRNHILLGPSWALTQCRLQYKQKWNSQLIHFSSRTHSSNKTLWEVMANNTDKRRASPTEWKSGNSDPHYPLIAWGICSGLRRALLENYWLFKSFTLQMGKLRLGEVNSLFKAIQLSRGKVEARNWSSDCFLLSSSQHLPSLFLSPFSPDWNQHFIHLLWLIYWQGFFVSRWKNILIQSGLT